MPDIRSFFGGGGVANVKSTDSARKKDHTSNPPKKQRARKVVSDDDDDDDEEITKPKKAATPKAKKQIKEPEVEETTSSAYFATSSKPKAGKSTPIRMKPAPSNNGPNQTPTKAHNSATPSTGRRSNRKTAAKSYAEDEDEDTVALLKDEDEGNDDIFVNDFKSRKAADDYEESTDNDEVAIKPGSRAKPNGHAKRAALEDEDEDGDIEMAVIPAYDGGADPKRKRGSTSTTASKKRKSKTLGDDDEDDFLDDDDDEAPKKKARKTASKPAAKNPRVPAKKEERTESKEIEDIFASIPTVRAPTPPPRDENKKFQFGAGGGNANAAPMAAGTKEIPEGAENCLAGLTFVFTGVLDSIGREEGQNLVKRYGGKTTTAPSKKTSYVVLGNDAGPKKLETIRTLGITTINEDGLFALIKKLPPNGGDGKAAEAYAEKRAKEEEKIKEEAEEMEKRDKERQRESEKAAKAAAARTGAPPPPKTAKSRVDDRLWVEKYAPDAITSVCGNKSAVEGLQKWLRSWHKNAASNFKKAGADGRGIYRAAMLHGPPGIGKTTAAHLVAKLEGFDIVETNASDTRSKKLVENGLRGVLDTTSLLGYFAGDGKKVEGAKKNLVLIMDEVDGMSAGDRGGVGALAAVAKKTSIPLILICNERRLPKMKPFDHVTADFPFRRPTVDMIRGRIATICYREGIKLPANVIQAIIEGSNADIRQIINMLSTIKLDQKDMDFNDSKAMSKAWEKHVILKPWDIVSKILRPQMFAQSSAATLNEKTELYFNDHEFSYLMLQENYLKTQPSLISSYSGKERNLKWLELAEKASGSISEGDLVDRMIHGSQQQWSLMPTHAIFSFVRPASYIYGNFNNQVGFASWLGQNSKQGKLSRLVKELQGHMRLRTSADRHEIRQQYLPALWNRTAAQLIASGKEAVPDMIDFMDSYYLTKEDYDSIIELGVGPMDMELPTGVKKLDAQTKAAFTRLYNSQNHPMPFMKASNVLGATKVGAGAKRDKPDLEEAVEDSDADEGAVEDDAKDDAAEEDMDISKDKYVKVPKKKAAPKAKASAGAGKGKRKKGDDDDDDEIQEDSEEEVKPKKKAAGKKGKAKA